MEIRLQKRHLVLYNSMRMHPWRANALEMSKERAVTSVKTIGHELMSKPTGALGLAM
jgi:hypothetical protein